MNQRDAFKAGKAIVTMTVDVEVPVPDYDAPRTTNYGGSVMCYTEEAKKKLVDALQADCAGSAFHRVRIGTLRFE